MKEADIIEKEKTHLQEPEGHRTIHLYDMGKFQHAYNYSAFLLNRFKLKEITAVKPHNKKDRVFLGFPKGSLENFVSPDDMESAVEKEDGTIDIVLSANLFAETDTPESLAEDYANWAACVPESEGRAKDAPSGVPALGGLFSILKEVLDYPLDRKTPADNMTFISELKRKIAKAL